MRRAISTFAGPAVRGAAQAELNTALVETGTVTAWVAEYAPRYRANVGGAPREITEKLLLLMARDTLSDMHRQWGAKRFRHGDFRMELGHDDLLVEVLRVHLENRFVRKH